ncbi:FtsW/RodA/SpoVE family cell cycle protein [Chloroflexota bacterium]
MIAFFINRQIKISLQDSDLFLFPITALLAGWGILTIWRLIPLFGFRQSIWFILIGSLIVYLIRGSKDLSILKKYKYLWLFAGLLLTSLTISLGVNPMGGGPRLWLGCCGLYFQPSEPLKLLFIIFLAAYFADQILLRLSFTALIIPSFLVAATALLILIVQQDLGTALIFVFLYSSLLFIATGQKKVLLIFILFSLVSSLIGYFLFDVIRLRIDSWINPWIDPSGRSYQIIQSLISVSNGAIIGRGPGGGYPDLVPVAISDFIFTSISEEFGLIGTIGIILLFGFITYLGIRTALKASDRFQQFLALGITSYFIFQSLLIMGGNLRLLPLTGVTLPFVSYGGSSLLTSFIALLILLIISNQADERSSLIFNPQPFLTMANFLFLGLLAVSLTNGWWSVWRGPDLLSRSDNARRSISDLYVKRGSLLSRNGELINTTVGTSGSFQRKYQVPNLSPITGYTHTVFGQAGLESNLDEYLRGLSGYKSGTIILEQLLFGQPPPGLDVRTSITLKLQAIADNLLSGHNGAAIMINAASGEILVMASHPNFDPNDLDQTGPSLSNDPNNPLLNRAAQGLYPAGESLDLFLLPMALTPDSLEERLNKLYGDLGFYDPPEIRLPVAVPQGMTNSLIISPLQMVIAAAALSNDGMRPAPRVAIGLNTTENGWIILPPLSDSIQVYDPGSTKELSNQYKLPQQPFWEFSTVISDRIPENTLTWFIGGTLFDWSGTPLAVVILLEESNPSLAEEIGLKLLQSSIEP